MSCDSRLLVINSTEAPLSDPTVTKDATVIDYDTSIDKLVNALEENTKVIVC